MKLGHDKDCPHYKNPNRACTCHGEEKPDVHEDEDVFTTMKMLIQQHKGKTMIGSMAALLSIVYGGTETGYLPAIATREYVAQVVADKTRGLDYLVRSSLEKDLDVMRYAVVCMNSYQQAGALQRLQDQYRDLVGHEYQHKNCEDLERVIRVRKGSPTD